MFLCTTYGISCHFLSHFFPGSLLNWLDLYSILHLITKVASFTFMFYATQYGWNMMLNVAFASNDIFIIVDYTYHLIVLILSASCLLYIQFNFLRHLNNPSTFGVNIIIYGVLFQRSIDQFIICF